MNGENIYRGSQVRYAAEIIRSYQGDIPLHLFLKKYYSANKKHGSKDRRNITAMCYAYFRVKTGMITQPAEEKAIDTGIHLLSGSAFGLAFEKTSAGLKDKLASVKHLFNLSLLFPFEGALSKEIKSESFFLSFLMQPYLFLRIRPGKEATVKSKLSANEQPFLQLSPTCIALPNDSPATKILKIDREAVIQDYASQHVESFLKALPEQKGLKIWDCSAGSGGKSILAIDTLKSPELTVSDKRTSILNNLKSRFSAAGIHASKILALDLTQSVSTIADNYFDLIIADVPCSGSGTWARTPERLTFFKEKEIADYASLQRKIIHNVLPKLKPGGHLLYITCSVFHSENEDNIAFFKNQYQLKVLKMDYLKGFQHRADTLFGALLTR